MIKIDPETVTLSLSGGSNVGSLHFHTPAARYHIWVNLEPLEPRVDRTAGRERVILYMSPPLGSKLGDEAYFQTRFLDANAARNRPAVDRLFEIARERDLLTVARAERDEAERVKALRIEERRRLHVQRDLGPQLLDAIRELYRATEAKDAAAIKDAWAKLGELERLAEAPLESGRKVELRDRRKPTTSPSTVYAVNDRAAIESACLGRVQGLVLDDVLPEDIEVVSSSALDA
jgi:hypothetical protein